MKKRILMALLWTFLVLPLAACSETPEPVKDNFPTLPDFQQEQTPLEQLTSAIDAARNAGSCTVEYGTVRAAGESTQEDTYTRSVSADQPFDRSVLYAQVPLFPNNEGFLEDFCNRSIRVIPSNTGTFRYQLDGLSWDEAKKLLYSSECEEDFSGAVCSVSIDIDPDGRLSRIQIDLDTETETVNVFLSVAFQE